MPIDHRVLIADDDRELRTGVVDLLRGMHLEIFEAETGLDALRIVRVASIHLALLDMHMPGHSGLEVLAAIKRETLGVPCIFISGDATEAVRKMALAEGAWAVLKKPLEPKLLRSEVERALRLAG
jgi:CheY-like chemotaxis protein